MLARALMRVREGLERCVVLWAAWGMRERCSWRRDDLSSAHTPTITLAPSSTPCNLPHMQYTCQAIKVNSPEIYLPKKWIMIIIWHHSMKLKPFTTIYIRRYLGKCIDNGKESLIQNWIIIDLNVGFRILVKILIFLSLTSCRHIHCLPLR